MATTKYVIVKNNRRKDKKFRLTLRVIHERKIKYFEVLKDHQAISLTEREYKNLGKTGRSTNDRDDNKERKRRKNELKKIDLFIHEDQKRIDGILGSMPVFTFRRFGELYRVGNRLSDCFEKKIKELREEEKFGNVRTYTGAKNALVKFEDISIEKVDTEYVNNFIKSRSTYPGPYLRCLRHICKRHGNNVFDQVKIKTKTKKKTPLDASEVAKLIKYDTLLPGRRRTLDFWLMCYYGGGMNTKDWVFLRHDELFENEIRKQRAKTDVPLVIAVTEPLRKLIDRNRAINGDYLFDLVDHKLEGLSRDTRYNTVLNNMQRDLTLIAKELKLQKKLTPYVARHTHANILLNKGASLEQIKDSLGQKDLKSTQVYIGSFYLEEKMKTARLLHLKDE